MIMSIYRPSQFYIALLLLVLIPSFVHAEADCSSSKVDELKLECRTLIGDYVGTLQISYQGERRAIAIEKDAYKKGAECAGRSAKFLFKAFTACNPKSPAFNVAKCTLEIKGLTALINTCNDAVSLYQKSKSKYSEVKGLYNAAGQSFAENDGEDIIDQLKACDINSCYTTKAETDDLKEDLIERVEESITRVDNNIDSLETILQELRKCNEGEQENCTKSSEPELQAPEDPISFPSGK